jgi:cysteinyl-tRNA synthetase
MRTLLAGLVAALLAAPVWAQPRSFLYQLQNLNVAQAGASPFDLIVTDYSLDGSATAKLSATDVSTLRSGGRVALAYLSIGEAERYRFYWQPAWHPGSPSWLGPANPSYPDNFKVRYWDAAWQSLIFGAPGAYLDQIIDQGFDGVYLDVIDAFEFWGPDGNNERPTAAQDMVDFVKAIASYARVTRGRPNFQVFPQNGSQLATVDPSYIATVTGIGAEDTWTNGNRAQSRYQSEHVTAWLDLFRDAGKAVLVIDYPTTPRLIDAFYSAAEARGYVPYNAPRALDQYRVNPQHVPAPAGPTVTLDGPADGADVVRGTPPTFNWSGGNGAVDYRLHVSGYDSYRQAILFPSATGVLASPSFTPTAAQWRRILRQAANNGYGAVYWWVDARDANGVWRASRARRVVRLHEAVSTTVFWIGEPASPDNGFIANDDSAWDECWKERYGGIDDPANRNGVYPAGFTPIDNPFYVALPYNDLDSSGNHRWNLAAVVPWAKIASIPATDSAVKNHWVKITSGANTCYAQWEDVGPFAEADARYVFGLSRPRTPINGHAGLDVSPAVRDCLHIADGITPTNWRFVDVAEVPAGPWTAIVTTSQLNFNPPSCP